MKQTALFSAMAGLAGLAVLVTSPWSQSRASAAALADSQQRPGTSAARGAAAQSGEGQPGESTGSLPPGDATRGQYIVEHVAMCHECHSGRDDRGNILPGEKYMGGPLPPGPPWAEDWPTRAPRNAGLPGYSDEMARRLLTEGAIGRQGVRLRAPMPRFYMSNQDAADVIAFMRTLP